MVKHCVVCGKQVEWEVVKEEIEYILNQANALGMSSLTEAEQVACNGLVCSEECFCKLG